MFVVRIATTNFKIDLYVYVFASTLLAIPFVPVFYVITQRLSERRKPEAAGKP